MQGPAVEIRRAAAADLPGVAALIGRLNARPVSQSLHCSAQTAIAARAALHDPGIFPDGWERSFFIGADPDGEIFAAVGCQCAPDQSVGWIWGPWCEPARGDEVILGRLMDLLVETVPRPVHQLEAFLHANNRSGLHFLRTRGFRLGPLTHLYVARAADPDRQPPDASRPHLRAAHEVAFARLHAESFPASQAVSADELLAGRDEEHAIFTATDGLRLLGYICVSVNRAPREGFIEYLAVRPSARGRGLGEQLLRLALDWTYVDQRLPQAALCVSDWRAGAHRLYERAGFRREASGIAGRRARLD